MSRSYLRECGKAMRPRGRPPDLLWQHYVPKEPRYTEILNQFNPELPRLQLTLTLRLSVYHQKALQYPPTHDKAVAPTAMQTLQSSAFLYRKPLRSTLQYQTQPSRETKSTILSRNMARDQSTPVRTHHHRKDAGMSEPSIAAMHAKQYVAHFPEVICEGTA